MSADTDSHMSGVTGRQRRADLPMPTKAKLGSQPEANTGIAKRAQVLRSDCLAGLHVLSEQTG